MTEKQEYIWKTLEQTNITAEMSYQMVANNVRGEEVETLQVFYYYPERLVTNEKEDALKINNLYVKLEFNPNGTMINQIKGKRGSQTPEEYNAKYAHSHLGQHTIQDSSWHHFCLGTSPLFFTYNTAMEGFDKPTINKLSNQINIATQVESTIGKPYIRLSTVKGNQTRKVVTGIDESIVNALVTYVRIRPLKDWVLNIGGNLLVNNLAVQSIVDKNCPYVLIGDKYFVAGSVGQTTNITNVEGADFMVGDKTITPFIDYSDSQPKEKGLEVVKCYPPTTQEVLLKLTDVLNLKIYAI